MRRFPGWQPWLVAGDPWYTDDELRELIDHANRQGDLERQRAARQNSRTHQARAARRPTRRRRGR